jgi:hypothetical protein
MKRVPRLSAILFTIATIFLTSLTGRMVSATDAPAARQLPTEIHAEQTTPDITLTGGFSQVTGTGDFNGDGVSDFLVKYEHPVGDTGSFVFFKFGIIFGRRSPTQPVTINLLTDEPDLALTTRLKPPLWYSEIMTPGDINGDGLDDIAITQVKPQQTDSPAEAMIKVFYGSTEWRPGAKDVDALPADLTILPDLPVPSLIKIAGAADVNGDGFKDLLLTPRYTSGLTTALLLGPFAPGATIDLNARPPDVLIQVSDSYPVGPTYIADVNGDGIADVVVKRQKPGPFGLFIADLDIIFGSPSIKAGSTISFVAQTPDATVAGGGSVIQIGDVNGDGIADIIEGTPTYGGEPAPPPWYSGDVIMVFGSPSLHGNVRQSDVLIAGLPEPLSFQPIYQTTLGDHLGEALTIGDVNGDGRPDLIIGAPGETTDDKGRRIGMNRVHIVIGSPELKTGARIETSSTQQDVTISFDAQANGFGRHVASGDFNGDGVSDILVANESVGYVYFGGPLRTPQINAAKYKSKGRELRIFGTDLNGAARVEVNGVVLDQQAIFDAADGALILQGRAAELNLRDGKNEVVVLRKGARSNAIKIKLK